jgi:hypothetical protein
MGGIEVGIEAKGVNMVFSDGKRLRSMQVLFYQPDPDEREDEIYRILSTRLPKQPPISRPTRGETFCDGKVYGLSGKELGIYYFFNRNKPITNRLIRDLYVIGPYLYYGKKVIGSIIRSKHLR